MYSFTMDEASMSTYDPDTQNEEKRGCIKKDSFWHFTLYEILTLICTAAIPVAVAVYTVISTEQGNKEADQKREFDLAHATEVRQHTLYDQFLEDMYNLEKDGHLKPDKQPWTFANAYYRAMQRQWDATRKADILHFFKDKELIGKAKWLETRSLQPPVDVISLKGLNFDNVYLTSPTGSLNPLDFKYIAFDQVSMVNTKFSFVNVNGATFNHAQLDHVQFEDSSLASATFNGTILKDANFSNSDLTGTRFINVDLSTVHLTQDQLQQAAFENTTFPNGTFTQSTTTIGKIFSSFFLHSV